MQGKRCWRCDSIRHNSERGIIRWLRTRNSCSISPALGRRGTTGVSWKAAISVRFVIATEGFPSEQLQKIIAARWNLCRHSIGLTLSGNNFKQTFRILSVRFHRLSASTDSLCIQRAERHRALCQSISPE